MPSTKLTPSTIRYATEFKYWRETADHFFDIASKRIDAALESGLDDATVIEEIAEAWLKCMTAQWTLYKSGKQTAIRMGLKRGVDNRQFHPAQLRKNKADDTVAKALEGK